MFSGASVQASLAPSVQQPAGRRPDPERQCPRRLTLVTALLWGVCGALLPASGLAQPAPAAPAAATKPAAKPPVAKPPAAKPPATDKAPAADKPAPDKPADKPADKSTTKSPDKPAATDQPAADKAPAAAAGRPAAPARGGKAPAGKRPKAPAAPAEAEAAAAKLAPAPKSPVLSRAEQFQRAAPATVMLIAQHENRFNTSLGVIVKSHGVVISDSRLLSGVEGGQVFAFLYDPSLAGDEDPLVFLRAHKAAALPTQVVRVDPVTHLVMLQLPATDPKKPYKALELYDVRDITVVGLDVAAIRTRGRQTLALYTGSIASLRPDQIELEPDIGTESAGAPVLSPTGRLIGVTTFADKTVSASGVVRTIDQLHSLLAGKLGSAPSQPTAPSANEVGVDSRNGVESLRISLGVALSQKLDKKPALQLQSDFIASMALHGRIPVAVDSGEWLNALLAGLIKDNPPKFKAAGELFPLLATDKQGKIWRRVLAKVNERNQLRYDALRPSGHGIVAIDDVTEALYATDTHQQLMWYDLESKTWRNTGLSPVSRATATAGSLYVILADGRLMVSKQDGKEAVQLYPRSLKSATLESSQDVMYLIENGSVYRYRNQPPAAGQTPVKGWDGKLKPIAFAMQQLVVHGEEWYGLDLSGRVFSSVAQRYIDRDGNIARLWPIGRDLLVLTKDGQRFFYNVADDSWTAWSQW